MNGHFCVRVEMDTLNGKLTRASIATCEKWTTFAVKTHLLFAALGFNITVKNELLAEALKLLPERQRDIIMRYYYLGMSEGLIKSVVIYKLDRISRSILDFAGMIAMFQKYGVEFVSSTEKFDTSTPMGRTMLNICIVFAQLERETIATRVTDSFYSRCEKGFRMGGHAPYGYSVEPFVMNGVKTKRLEAVPEEAEQIRLMYEMYAEPNTSYGDITRRFAENGMTIRGRSPMRCFISNLLRNPVYVQADLDVYEFYKAQGANIINEPGDFAGINGCYIYREKGIGSTAPLSRDELQSRILVLAPHEGIIPSDLWLKCRRKLMNNHGFQGGRKAKNTWLAGKIKCGRCGYALGVIYHARSSIKYLRCHKRRNDRTCEGCNAFA